MPYIGGTQVSNEEFRRWQEAQKNPASVIADQKLLQGNPFTPGSKEYNDWVKNAVKNAQIMAGAPQIPEFVSALDSSGRLKENFRLQPGQISVGQDIQFQSVLPSVERRFEGLSADPRALAAIRDRALGQGASPWLNLQLQRQALEESGAIDDAARGAAGAQAQAESNMAMRGGLSSGARERLNQGGLEAALLSQQNVRRGGEKQRLDLQLQDEATRTNLLSQLPGMELAQIRPELEKAQYLSGVEQNQSAANLQNQWANRNLGIEGQKYNVEQKSSADRFNTQAALNDLLQKRAYDMGKYSELMKGFAAEKTGEAVGGGGKK